MSKSYRYDPDGEERGAEKRRRAGRRKQKEGNGANAAQVDGFDLAWAVDRMKEHISFIVGRLVEHGLIEEDEREEYTAMFNATVCEAGTQYDPDRKGEASGKTASPVHFMTMMVDSKLANVMDYLAYRRWTLKFQAITDDEEKTQGDCAFIWSGDKRLSDARRWRERIELRLDVETLFGMLSEEERMTLAMRLEGYTDIEIAEAITMTLHRPCDRFRVMRTYGAHIRQKARLCGFLPHGGTGGEKS